MNTALSTKGEIRERTKTTLRQIPAEEKAYQAKAICERISADEAWRKARSVLLYAPLADEPDVFLLIENALAESKLVALPRFNASLAAYEVASVRRLEDLSPPGPFGVREPAAACPSVELNQLDLALLPGIAFDVSGRRLGRGKGFYDRLLAGFMGIKCGVAFDIQVLTELPHEPHDVTLNCLMTPTRRLEFEPAPRL